MWYVAMTENNALVLISEQELEKPSDLEVIAGPMLLEEAATYAGEWEV